MKRGIFTLLFLITLVLTISPVLAATYQTLSDLTCSNEAVGWECARASDGNLATAWAGTADVAPSVANPKTITGDLGDTKLISGVRGFIPDTTSRRYTPEYIDVQVSTDGIDWTTVEHNWVINEGPWSVQPLPEVEARYVRLNVISCICKEECGWWEFCSDGWKGCGSTYDNICILNEFEALTEEIVCTPDCTSKECGDDGCGTSCGTCTNNHGTTQCNLNLCEPVCESGWGNCDGDNNNGCEINTDISPANCGTCGTICPIGVLCTNGVCEVPNDLYWANMLGSPITEAEIGDTVLMVYEKSDTTYSFEIREDDLTANDDIRVGANAIQGIVSSGKNIAKYTITQEDFDSSDDPLDTTAEFFFTTDSQDSPILTIEQDSYDNSPPDIQLTKPLLDEKFKTQTSIDFEQTATDEDDDLEITWDFGDQSSETLSNCLSTTNCDTTHAYTQSGSKSITVTAKEMTREREISASTRIFLYQSGTNLFPIITTPTLGSTHESTTIDFDASNSFVAERSETTCPGASCYNVDTLQCYDLPKTDIPAIYNLKFNWTFTEGNSIQGDYNTNYAEVVEFTGLFLTPGQHLANLKLGYTTTDTQWSNYVSTNFELLSTTPYCVSGSETSSWRYWDIPSSTIITEEVTDTLANCFNIAGQPSSTCCPDNAGECITELGHSDFGTCSGSEHPLYCEDYNADRYGGDITQAEDACNNYHSEVGERSTNRQAGIADYCGSTISEFDSALGNTCWRLVSNCRCKWDDTNDVCESKFSLSGSSCAGGGPDAGTCRFITVAEDDQCSTLGTITYSWEARWEYDLGNLINDPSNQPPLGCQDKQKQFLCEDVPKLPFFTLANFIISIISIFFIYTIMIRKEIKKSKI